jgi:hypothetical protein
VSFGLDSNLAERSVATLSPGRANLRRADCNRPTTRYLPATRRADEPSRHRLRGGTRSSAGTLARGTDRRYPRPPPPRPPATRAQVSTLNAASRVSPLASCRGRHTPQAAGIAVGVVSAVTLGLSTQNDGQAAASWASC